MTTTATGKAPAKKLNVTKKERPEEAISDAVEIHEDVEETGPSEAEVEAEIEELEEGPEEDEEGLSTEEIAKRKAEAKEARKQAAFEKLRAMNQEKKVARKTELTETTQKVQSRLKQGDIKFSTRASYYGVRCRVEKVEEVRGRILVTVTCMTTKGGADLPEERYYTRRFSPDFLQDEKPVEAYVPRRGGAVKAKKISKAEEKRRAKQAKAEAAKNAAAESGESDEEVTVVEDENDELEEELEEDEDEDEDDESESDEATEDSWA